MSHAAHRASYVMHVEPVYVAVCSQHNRVPVCSLYDSLLPHSDLFKLVNLLLCVLCTAIKLKYMFVYRTCNLLCNYIRLFAYPEIGDWS